MRTRLNSSVPGVGRVAAVKAGDRVGLGYGPKKKLKKTVE